MITRWQSVYGVNLIGSPGVGIAFDENVACGPVITTPAFA